MLSAGADRAAAQVAPLDGYMNDLSHVIPAQRGGNAPFGASYVYKLNGGRRQSRRQSRNQRGGNAPFGAPYSLGLTLPGVNPQFANEHHVNSLYSQTRGAQGY